MYCVLCITDRNELGLLRKSHPHTTLCSMPKNNTGATIRLKSLIFFRRNVVPDPFFRPIVVLGELSIRRNGFRRNVVNESTLVRLLDES